MSEDTTPEPGELDESRAKYDADDRQRMAKSGAAMPDGSYPIADAEDLDNAIHAVGRGAGSHDAIRKHIIARAKALGLSNEIPDNWNADGTMRSDDPVLERRRATAAQLDGAMENRRFEVSGIEIREVSDGGLRFTGYASTTERGYEVGDFVETIARGAFKRTLSESPDTVLLINHEGLPLARTKSGSMSLAEDARGLRVDADLDPNRSDVQDLALAMRRGDIDQMSFAFRVTDQQWSDDYSERLIRSVTIHRGDVSIVTMGANEATSSQIMSRNADELERRAGKAFSAANKAKIQGALDTIYEVLEPANSAEEPVVEEPVVEPPRLRSRTPDHTSIARAEFDLLVARSRS